jgi:flagellin
MALIVNTNIQALNAQNNLTKSGSLLSKAMTRLSSGLRVNSAADDAAGLAISTRLASQIRGLSQAIRNANDGVAILQTAEGALNEITSITTRIKELSVQSATGSNSASDRTSLNNEVQSLISEVTRIAVQTKFGTTALMDGSFNVQFQVGVNAGETVGAAVANYRASSLSASVASQALTFQAAVTNVGAADANTYTGVGTTTTLQVSGPKGVAFARVAVAGDDTASYMENTKSAIATSKVINEISSQTGVTASVTAATFTTTDAAQFTNDINLDGSSANKTVKINGQQVTVNLNGGSVAADRQLFIDAVNSQVSGVTAATSGTAGLTLTAADGRNISVVAAGTGANVAGGEIFGFTTTVAAEKVLARGGLTLQAGGSITSTFLTSAQVGGDGTTAASNTTLSAVDISSVAGANTAMLMADSILDTISAARGSLGAVQNRFASTVANLATVVEKVSDANSRIVDADFAAEVAMMTRGQILQQAGIAILSQANSAPEAALTLLRR